MAELPTGTVTFLFTDIEGSTTRWEQQPQAMQRALARHDAILREVIEEHGGVVFKTVGDAFCAAFAMAPAAVEAALAAQRALQSAAWGDPGPLRVRMALHTGMAEARDRDYFGPTLNRVARLLAAGYGGQTLLSLATEELVRDHLPPDVVLHDLGQHRLKDLIRPEHIFQLSIPDLPSDFPPLKTLEVRSHNLPVQSTVLIGRTQELAALRQRLLQPAIRLVTLTGPGGTGKTRLSLQAAAELLDDFADGVYFVALASISDAVLVASTITQALGVREAAGQPLDSLKRFLRDKALLLVLDNFEQVLAAAPVVADLLATAPRLKVLVTSRVVLHLSGEHEFPVPPLAVPDPRRLPPRHADLATSLSQYAAVALFILRAEAAKPDFQVTTANAPAIAEICWRLDGLPLAIELAAARIKLFTPQALLQRLESRLTLLTGGARDLPERQQTLRGAIDWSYDLLEPEEQTLFARLAVFAGGCTVEAAEAVVTDQGPVASADKTVPPLSVSPLATDHRPLITVVDGLQSLVDKSLLRQETTPGGDERSLEGEPRLVMLRTIHEYALERLRTSREAEALRERHAAYYLHLAEATMPELVGPQQVVYLRQLETEHDNLRAALRWTLERVRIELAARLCVALGRFWYTHAHLSEGRRWLEAVLAADAGDKSKGPAGATSDEHGLDRATLPPAIRANVLHHAGVLASEQRDYARATALFEDGLALHRMLGNKESEAATLNSLGIVARYLGDTARATELLEASVALRRELGDWQGASSALSNLGIVALDSGDPARAEGYFTESLALDREQGNPWGVAATLVNLGYVTQIRGDSAQAQRLLTESLALFRDVGDTEGIAEVLEGLAMAAGARGHPAQAAQRAARLYGAAEAMRETIESPLSAADRPYYEQAVQRLHTHLDEATFATAWTEGRAMSLEQAIAYALEETPDA